MLYGTNKSLLWFLGRQSSPLPSKVDARWLFKSCWYYGKHPSSLQWKYSDRDAFYGTDIGLGIIKILELTGQFDEVILTPKPVVSRSTLDNYVVAMVIPMPVKQVQDGSPQVSLRSVSYSIVIEAIIPTPEDSAQELDRLESVVLNSLLGGISYGGFTYSWKSTIQRNDYASGLDPARQRWLSGVFSYTYYSKEGQSEKITWQR
jgi:hypothetical protein